MRNHAIKPEVHDVLCEVRRIKNSSQITCPHCGDPRIRRWGSFSGRQRYRCNTCRRTFSDLTKTSLAFIRKLDLWPQFVEHMAASETIRRTAEELDLHPCTVFRWRHAALQGMKAADKTMLAGMVELGETGFPISHKGSRKLDRPARTRGLPHTGKEFTVPHVCALFACDRNGLVCSDLILHRHPFLCNVREGILTRLAGPATVIGSYPMMSSYAKATRLCGHAYQVAPRFKTSHDTEHHTRNIQSYVALLKTWLLRFRGVATRYLANYLTWHHYLHMLAPDKLNRGIHRALVVAC